MTTCALPHEDAGHSGAIPLLPPVMSVTMGLLLIRVRVHARRRVSRPDDAVHEPAVLQGPVISVFTNAAGRDHSMRAW